MIEQLKKIFPSLIVYDTTDVLLDTNYEWYMTPTKEIIGIHEDELTAKDGSLLETFMSPYNTAFPVQTPIEQKWQRFIHADDNTSEDQPSNNFRFVFFTIQQSQIDPNTFKEAITELFATEVPILWENSHQGVIIEEKKSNQETISYEQIIDVLMSDLYVKLNFYVGPYAKRNICIQDYYHSLIKKAEIAHKYSSKAVVTYVDAIPYFLIEQTEGSFKMEISNSVLQDYIDDEDSLKMIETFIQCNLNISETAKELYMHRNSLQYRLDRFQEKTGIDVRQFRHALSVYLALLANRS